MVISDKVDNCSKNQNCSTIKKENRDEIIQKVSRFWDGDLTT